MHLASSAVLPAARQVGEGLALTPHPRMLRGMSWPCCLTSICVWPRPPQAAAGHHAVCGGAAGAAVH